jgi:Holliday junction resolvase-like predicted endonuclease
VGVKRQGGLYWIWALIYSPLTLAFLGIAIYTFTSFLANGSASVVISATGKADGATLIRALTGWSYALVELLHAGVGARYSSCASETTTTVPQVDIQATISQAIGELAAQLQDEQARLFEELGKQQEQRLGQMDLQQQQHLLMAIQEVKARVPTIDHQTLIEAVSATCETHLQAKIEALLSKPVTVSPVSETLHIAGPRNVSPTPKRNPRAGKATLTTRAKTEGEGDPETVVYRLLDEDGSRTHRVIAKMTGIPDTTVYRIRKRYLAERGNTVSSEREANETAM